MNATGPMNKVRVGFFSFTEVTDPGQHRSYNEWHQLDHMPEQYPLPGIAFGQRWVSTPACRAARAADEELLRPIHYVTLYLMTEPVEETLSEFMELGRRLSRLGRFHRHRRAHLSGPFQLAETYAAPRVLVSAEAVPYRPNRGVYVVVEEGAGDAVPPPVEVRPVLETAGVAGVWAFTERAGRAGAAGRRITVCYLDGEPVEVAGGLRPVLEARWREGRARPVLAGPFESITPWRWDWFD